VSGQGEEEYSPASVVEPQPEDAKGEGGEHMERVSLAVEEAKMGLTLAG
jgi:hypothetical protein